MLKFDLSRHICVCNFTFCFHLTQGILNFYSRSNETRASTIFSLHVTAVRNSHIKWNTKSIFFFCFFFPLFSFFFIFKYYIFSFKLSYYFICYFHCECDISFVTIELRTFHDFTCFLFFNFVSFTFTSSAWSYIQSIEC